jgi:RNA polymerase sigma-70 factor (ECF subfamily)
MAAARIFPFSQTRCDMPERRMVDERSSLILKPPLDAEAVGELYDAFYDPIYRYCLRRLYYREQAEDSVSEIFLTMARRIGEFRGATMRDFRAWLYVIAANHVNQTLRRKLCEDRMLDNMAEQVSRHEPGSRERRWVALHRAILLLGEEEQHLISLRFFEGLPYDEIASLVGKRAGNIRVKVHRALKELRPTLQRYLDDDFVREDHHGR